MKSGRKPEQGQFRSSNDTGGNKGGGGEGGERGGGRGDRDIGRGGEMRRRGERGIESRQAQENERGASRRVHIHDRDTLGSDNTVLKEDLPNIINLRDMQSSIPGAYHYPTIENVETIGSFNWLEQMSPTILIPGSPPAWTPPEAARKLSEDKGRYFRDPNTARYPKYPTEPGILACLKIYNELETTNIDVVGCGSTMGNILRFAASKAAKFEMNAEVIGNTLFLVREEGSPTKLIPNVRGYGHTFPDAYTTWDFAVRSSASNQRLIQYHFGGLKYIVRFECDGYFKERVTDLEDLTDSESTATSLPKENVTPSPLPDIDSILLEHDIPVDESELEIEYSGRLIPQEAIFDIKTRSSRTGIDMEEVYARLWVRQVPNFIIAYHSAGLFQDIQIQDLREPIRNWELENAELLRTYNATLGRIREITRKSKFSKIRLRRDGKGPLQVEELGLSSFSALSPGMRAMWLAGD